MNFFELTRTANRNLWTNKARSILTIIAIFVGSFAIILNSAISAGVNDFIDKQVASIGGDGFIEVMPSSVYNQVASSAGSGSVREYSGNSSSSSFADANIPDEDFQELKEVDGVENLEVFHNLSVEWMKSEDEEKKYEVDVEYFPLSSINIDLSSGRMVDDQAEENEILITKDWLEPLGFSSAEDALGKTVEIGFKQTAKCYYSDDCITSVKAKIVGIQAPGIFSATGELHINKALDNEIYDLANKDLPDSAKNNMFAVGEVDSRKLDSIRSSFSDLGYSIITVSDTVGVIRNFLNVILLVLNIFGGIALIAAAIGIINTLLMSVEERTREIGLEKALGMSQPKIFAIFSLEAISLGFWGSVLGVAVAAIFGNVANSMLHESSLFSSFPTLTLVKFSPEVVIPIIIIVMFIAFLAGTIPAIKAAKKDPIEALRYE